MQKKAIIVFPDTWLSYSPTVINLSELLSNRVQVVILTVGKEGFLTDTFQSTRISVEFLDVKSHFIKSVVRRIDTLFISLVSFLIKTRLLSNGKHRELLIGYNLENYINTIRFSRKVRKLYQEGDFLIGVDNIGAYSLTRIGLKFHMLSLEIARNLFYRFIDFGKIKSLVIQTVERKAYIFPSKYANIKTYLVQNSPVLSFPSTSNRADRFKIIYLGNLAIEYNALDKIVDALYCLPSEYSVTLKGYYNKRTDEYFHTNYRDLIDSGRLRIDYHYIANADLPEYLSAFSFGLSFYNISVLPYENFNVVSCPSGKLFNYYNSSIPVVGNDIVGLKSVKDFEAGILIDKLSGKEIASAILKIAEDYNKYSLNSRSAAVYFDFKRNAEVFFDAELNQVELL